MSLCFHSCVTVSFSAIIAINIRAVTYITHPPSLECALNISAKVSSAPNIT